MRKLIVSVFLCLCLVGQFWSGARAQDSDSTIAVSDIAQYVPKWKDLDQDQQKILQSFKSRFDNFAPRKRLRLIAGADRFKDLSPAQRKQLRKNIKIFRQLPKAQKKIVCRQYHKQHGSMPHFCKRLLGS